MGGQGRGLKLIALGFGGTGGVKGGDKLRV